MVSVVVMCSSTVKKVTIIYSRPQPGCHSTNSPWPGIMKLFLAREILVNDIPAGDGQIDNLFCSARTVSIDIVYPFEHAVFV
jgi:hypothetical protein